MQNYYIKKAKECEAAVAALQGQIESMNKDDALKLKEKMASVRKEMKNYNEAVARVTADA
jgi:predicted nuclease of restriction endonuclease-like (RecB) superfamily